MRCLRCLMLILLVLFFKMCEKVKRVLLCV